MELFDLSDKVVLVTGGYGYLGIGLCRGLAAAGASVIVLGRSQASFDQRLAHHSPNIRFVICDVADSGSVRDAFATVEREQGRINVLINNAMFVRGQDPLGISDEDWALTIDGNLNSVYRCIREVSPYFQKNSGGKIINICSMYGLVSPDFSVYDESPEYLNPPHYGAAKAAVIQLTRYFARYLGPRNIQVNAISPGAFPNETVQQNAAFTDKLKKKTALGRIGQPHDLAGAVVFLSSPASDYVTGHNLVVDGGWTCI